MKERLDSRVLGAVRWLDAVTAQPITHPLAVTAGDLRFVRNLSGLSVIVAAKGLEAYEACLDLDTLPPEQEVDDLSLDFTAAVTDPTGRYLPRRFDLKLPRVAQPPRLPNGQRPANSLFDPVPIALLPGPLAPVAAGWAQVRVTARTAEDQPLKHLYLRVVATADDAVLGRGMTRDIWSASYDKVLPIAIQDFDLTGVLPAVFYMFRFGYRRGKGRFLDTFGSNAGTPKERRRAACGSRRRARSTTTTAAVAAETPMVSASMRAQVRWCWKRSVPRETPRTASICRRRTPRCCGP
mgnify:CR=1 FL=1